MGEPAQISCTFPERKGQTDPGNSDDCPPPDAAPAPVPSPQLFLLQHLGCREPGPQLAHSQEDARPGRGGLTSCPPGGVGSIQLH